MCLEWAGEGGPLVLHLRSHYSNFSWPVDKKVELVDCALSLSWNSLDYRDAVSSS